MRRDEINRAARLAALYDYEQKLGLQVVTTIHGDRKGAYATGQEAPYFQIYLWPGDTNGTGQDRSAIVMVKPDGSWVDFIGVDEIAIEKGLALAQAMVKATAA